MIKGIGIIAVVAGHALNTNAIFDPVSDSLRRWIYTFNISSFILASGYLWKKRPLRETLIRIFKKRYVPFVIVHLLSLFLIPLWLWGGVHIEPAIPSRIAQTLRFGGGGGLFVGATWFVRLLAITELMFAFYDMCASAVGKQYVHIILSIISGIIGIFLTEQKLLLTYNFNVALMMEPIMLLGRYAKEHPCSFLYEKSKVICPVSLIAILAMNCFSGNEIEFTMNRVYGGYLLYPMLLLGLLFCDSLARVLVTNRWLTQIICRVGQASFAIMSLHFIVFKLVDILFAKFVWIGQIDVDLTPVADSRLRILYFIFGLLIPVGCKALFLKARTHLFTYKNRA